MVAGVKVVGVLQVLTAPRTTVSQSMSATPTIELEDNAVWELLIELVQKGAHPLIAKRFGHALEQEETHLAGAQLHQARSSCVSELSLAYHLAPP
ncbi:hypothetical protein [Pseudomonas sp. R1-6]|uniref:hypothetical protein n=1 Tax=Pseudomonas sp. R1-6 TaxID=2817397 RepID=UPI003DA86489